MHAKKYFSTKHQLSEGFFLGIIQDLISKVLFEKKVLTNIMILIYYILGSSICFKIIKNLKK